MWRTSVDEWKVFNEHLLTMRVTDAQREEFIERFVPAPEAAIVSTRVMTNIENARRDLRGILASETSEGVKHPAYGVVPGAVESRSSADGGGGKERVRTGKTRG